MSLGSSGRRRQVGRVRQLPALRADIGKLEERRDTLVRRKQALRELIVSQTRAKLMSGA